MLNGGIVPPDQSATGNPRATSHGGPYKGIPDGARFQECAGGAQCETAFISSASCDDGHYGAFGSGGCLDPFGRSNMRNEAMRMRCAAGVAIVLVSAAFSQVRSAPFARVATSEVYIQQSSGRVAPGTNIQTKPPPEAGTATAAPSTSPTAPETCNAQNASSQACYTATQQARPPGR